LKVTYLDYGKVYEMLLQLEGIDKYDRIVGIGRAGIILAGMLATMHDKRLSYVVLGKENGVYPVPDKSEKILLVDDVLATGKTMKIVEEMFKGYDYDIYVIVDGIDRAKYRPEKYMCSIVAEESNWILFPWDLIDFVIGERKSYSRWRV